MSENRFDRYKEINFSHSEKTGEHQANNSAAGYMNARIRQAAGVESGLRGRLICNRWQQHTPQKQPQ